MHVEVTDSTEQEIWVPDGLRCATISQADNITFQFRIFAGPRILETQRVRPINIKRTDICQYRLRIVNREDATNGGRNSVNAYFPDDVKRDIHRCQREHDTAPDHSVVDLKQLDVRAILRQTANRIPGETGGEGQLKVFGRDVHRRFARRLLVDEQENLHVVMMVDGLVSRRLVHT
jgi:hypothetical protein